jgi:hypothetical protein
VVAVVSVVEAAEVAATIKVAEAAVAIVVVAAVAVDTIKVVAEAVVTVVVEAEAAVVMTAIAIASSKYNKDFQIRKGIKASRVLPGLLCPFSIVMFYNNAMPILSSALLVR